MPKATFSKNTNHDNDDQRGYQLRRGSLPGLLLAFFVVACITSTGTFYTTWLYRAPNLPGGFFKNKSIIEFYHAFDARSEYYSYLLNRTTKTIVDDPLITNPPADNDAAVGGSGRSRSRIAILSNFVSKDTSADAVYDKRDHLWGPLLMNKACYADLWGYDFIYNTTWGFPDDIRGRNDSDPRLCFLDSGHWHRVPQLIALTQDKEKNYEWILWADNDYVIWDMTQSLESILKELEVNNLHNVHVVAPDDGWGNDTPIRFVFSSYAVLIRNSPFGRAVLQNWMEYAKGLCPSGNFDTNGCKNYHWLASDQPGLWYAMAKTYSDLVEGSGEFVTTCNKETGYCDQATTIGLHMSEYFIKEGLVKSTNYSQIPHDQPILWSSYEKNTQSGIGINHCFISGSAEDYKGVFAIHKKEELTGKLQHSQIRHCAKPVEEGGRGCFVGTNQRGVFDISCGNTSYVVWDSKLKVN